MRQEQGLQLRSVTHDPAETLRQRLLGSLPEIQADILALLRSLGPRGDAVRFRAAFKGLHLLVHPAAVEHVLIGHAKNYDKRTFGYRKLEMVVGKGLLTSGGAFWLRQRRIAQPAFHRKRIEALAGTMVGAAELSAEELLEQRGREIDLSHAMMRTTLRIVGLTLFSRDLTADAQQVGDAVDVGLAYLMYRIQHALSAPLWVPTQRNRRFRSAVGLLDGTVAEIIAERRQAGVGDRDLLDLLMAARDEESGEGMSDAQLRDEVATLILAGHETTAMALTWTLHCLAGHPQVEERLLGELGAVLGGAQVSLEALATLPYLDAVVKEAMRLYPPAWFITRRARKDDVIGGHRVRANEFVMFSPFVTQRDPRWFPQPEAFLPERFLPEKSDLLADPLPRFAYFPFGGGQRKCIGDRFAMMEAKLVLAVLLPRLRFVAASEGGVALEPLITLRPRGGLPMRVEAR